MVASEAHAEHPRRLPLLSLPLQTEGGGVRLRTFSTSPGASAPRCEFLGIPFVSRQTARPESFERLHLQIQGFDSRGVGKAIPCPGRARYYRASIGL